MKKIFMCLVALWVITPTYAQLRDTSVSQHKADTASFLLKSKKQITAAWIILGSGAAMTITGLSIITKDAGEEVSATLTSIFTLGSVTPEETKRRAAGPILAIAGTTAMLGSIPLFTASGKNKRKAEIIIKNESVFFNPQLNIKEHLLSAGLKINF